jgi:NAD(P)-dependent dehydrogenase (short-subunit alcohol dehydrogenase family)
LDPNDPQTSAASGRQRTVLVAGASSGIGRAVSAKLLEGGHRVVGLARDFTRFPCAHPDFAAEEIDLADLDRLPVRLAALLERWPGTDAAVLGSGRGQFGHIEEFAFADVRSLIELNFIAQAYLARALMPLFKRRGGGDLVFLGSEAALAGRRRGAVYCASKFALRGFAQALREEGARAGIRVSIVHPGLVKTPFFDELGFEPGAGEENHLLPEDVAAVIAQTLESRRGAVIEEVSLQPLKPLVRFRRRGHETGDAGERRPPAG